MFDVVPSKEHVRLNVVRKVLDSVSLGSALVWTEAFHGPLDIQYHAKIFGIDGHVLVVRFSDKILSSLVTSCQKARDFFVPFVDASYKDRVHKTTCLKIDDVLEHCSAARKKVCPEVVHAFRHVHLSSTPGTSVDFASSDVPRSNKDVARDLDS